MRLASRGRKRDELLSCLSSPVTTNQARQTRFAGNKRGHVDKKPAAPSDPATHLTSQVLYYEWEIETGA